MAENGRDYSCPSAQPDMEDARIFGIVSGTAEAPRVAFLKAGARVGEHELAKLGPINPTHVFRFTGKCEEGRCAQFRDGHCSLGKRIATGLAAVVDALPPCTIRPTCRWFAEEGENVCYRCPQVVTLVSEGVTPLNRVAALPQPSSSGRSPDAAVTGV